jgi:superfamily II RNA helicase
MDDMGLTAQPHFLNFLPTTLDADDILSSFFDAMAALGITPYKAQEDAIIELMSGKHVVLATPTGSGKSLVAEALHFKGFCEKKRSYYTCPIKALVSEKFFNLCNRFGAENVGMLTGDVSINRDALIICCTAEVLSNLAIAEGAEAHVDYVIMDEFHYYSDSERGVAWQIPLLTLPRAQFLLMSATIGACEGIKQSLKENTGLDVAEISSMERPVPLDFSYCEAPLHETLANLIASRKYPVYVVNFTQRECAFEAQNAMSVNICTKEEKQKIYEALAGFRFDTPFGKDIKRFISHGVGIHHAGLLPKYRLLIEKLAQAGLLKIIMGTDTLGVGVNVPIRTVVFTKLYKFDGKKTSLLSVRDFKQIAGRAGRKGFDDAGSVIVEAPEHVIENKRAEGRVSADKKHKKKVVKKAAPVKNYVHYDEASFEKLVRDPPEPLESQFTITHGMILNALMCYQSNGNQGYKNLVGIIARCHEHDKNKSKLRKRLAQLFKSLLQAQIFSTVKNINTGLRIVANESLQQDFSLFHTLSLYLIEALSVLDKDHPDYALDILSLVEAIEENPTAILIRQLEKKKDEAMAGMKADGLDYDARIEALEKIEYDKPLKDFIYQTFNEFQKKHPWVLEENIHPKSIARDMFFKGATFNEYVSEFGLARAEGLLLRYVSQTYKTLVQSVPEQYKSDEVLDIIAYLRTMLARVDKSLIEEWESMFEPTAIDEDGALKTVELKPYDPRVNHKAFVAKVRAEFFHLVRLLSQKNYEEALAVIANTGDDAWTIELLEKTLEPFFREYRMITDPRARNPQLTKIHKESDTIYVVTQTILDDKEDNMWHLDAKIDLEKLQEESMPIIWLVSIAD